MQLTQCDPAHAAVQISRAKAGTRPRILVLLASHNGERWITEQIRSILAQTEVNVQINVRDDASSDQTRCRIAPFLDGSIVRLTCSDVPTGSAAQNYFALIRENAADDFDFVAFSDQDDTWHVDKLSRACRHLSSDSCAGYSSATIATWADGTSKVLTQGNRKTTSDYLFGGAGQGCTFVLTRDFYNRSRDFLSRNPQLTAPIHYHDWTLYALASAWGLSWIFDPTPSVVYRQHCQNDTGARSSVAGVRKRLTLIRQGWYAKQLRAIAALCATANPSNVLLTRWNSMLSAHDTWTRRLEIARFCAHGGRRTLTDNAIVIMAALCGCL